MHLSHDETIAHVVKLLSSINFFDELKSDLETDLVSAFRANQLDMAKEISSQLNILDRVRQKLGA